MQDSWRDRRTEGTEGLALDISWHLLTSLDPLYCFAFALLLLCIALECSWPRFNHSTSSWWSFSPQTCTSPSGPGHKIPVWTWSSSLASRHWSICVDQVWESLCNLYIYIILYNISYRNIYKACACEMCLLVEFPLVVKAFSLEKVLMQISQSVEEETWWHCLNLDQSKQLQRRDVSILGTDLAWRGQFHPTKCTGQCL